MLNKNNNKIVMKFIIFYFCSSTEKKDFDRLAKVQINVFFGGHLAKPAYWW